jgi:3-oxoacyl-[acyl-carrier-protein] synthase III
MAKILGLGQHLPHHIRFNSDWDPKVVDAFKISRQRELIDVFDEKSNLDEYSRAGFKSEADDAFLGAVERRIAPDDFPSFKAEILAGNLALLDAGVDPKDVNALYSWAAIPDVPSITSGPLIAHELGMTNAFSFGLEGACASGIAHLNVASALIDSGQANYVLLTQSHLITRAIPMPHPASPCLGDAATAILVGPDREEGHKIVHTYSRSHGEFANAVVWKRRTGDQGWYNPGEGFSLGSFASEQAKELVQKTIPLGARTMEEALAEKNISVKQLSFFTSVQPRKWIPSSIAQYMGLKAEQSCNTFEKYAHLGGCGPLVNLMAAQYAGQLNKGDLVGLYAQGAGFTRSAAIIEW